MANENGTATAKTRRFGGKRMLAAALSLATVGGVLLGVGQIDQVSAAMHPQRGHQRGECFRAIAGGIGLNNVLDDLVADGTITDAQETAILDRIAEARADHPGACTGIMLIRDGAIGDAVSDLLGMDRGEIREAWLDGQSLTEMAAANSVDRQTLIDTIVDALGIKLDELVADEKLTPERRDEIVANALPVIERAVDLHRGELRDELEGSDPDVESSPVTNGAETLFG